MPSDDLVERLVEGIGQYLGGTLADAERPVLAHRLRTLASRVDPSPAGTRRDLLRVALSGLTDAEVDQLVDVIARAHDVLLAGGEVSR